MIFRLSIIVLCTLGAGCADIQPWERGNLAKEEMAFEPSPAQAAFRNHGYSAREAAYTSGSSATGGGCGCY